jgi:hypothetical protein
MSEQNPIQPLWKNLHEVYDSSSASAASIHLNKQNLNSLILKATYSVVVCLMCIDFVLERGGEGDSPVVPMAALCVP